VSLAVSAAEAAFPSWSSLGMEERAAYLLKVADRIEANMEELALAESMDQGKPVALARKMDIPRAAYNFRKFAHAWSNLLETADAERGVLNYSTRSPIGVCGLISPWNLPLYLLTFKVAPAIMAGNTVVCKPSELTSVTAWMMAKIMQEVNLPPGVVNVVFGYGTSVGEAIVTHPKVRMVSFTGSTPVGKRIAALTSPSMKKVSLELGGKNAAIVFSDANLEDAVNGLIRSCFLNQGEICLCTSRVFVQQNIYQDFLTAFVEKIRGLKTGDPLDESTFTGAVNSLAHYNKVMSYIKYAREEGGTILCGEGVDDLRLPDRVKDGFFIQPTLITGLQDNSRCMQDEIFGPVACLTPFTTEEEVVLRTNNSRYGLCASVWCQDVSLVHRVAQQLHVGTVWANCWLLRNLDMPFGGCKESGMGREGTRHSLEAFTEEKTVCLKIS